MQIRIEKETDETDVRLVNTSAFEATTYADLVDALRKHARPVVSLVAEVDDSVVGHIMFSPVTLSGHPELKVSGLAPLAVAPGHQRAGIGSALVRAGLEQCKQLGFVAATVLGHPEYYPRFGFTPSSRFGIDSEYDAPENAFMVLEIQPGALNEVNGTVKYHNVFNSL
ncbi:N-acetyltransferase [bacterium]|nr:N-acetyltransferase [bacterium]